MWSRELCYELTNIEELKDYYFENSDQTRYFEPAREKNTKLSTDAIHEIIEEIQGRKISIKEISIKYECSISNVYRIKIILNIILNHKRERMNLRFVQEIESI